MTDVRLLLGDCLAILPTLSGIDAVVTDPPYGIGFAAQPTKWQRRAGKSPVAWDNCTVCGLESVLALGEKQIVWGGNYYSLKPSRCWLAWYKPDAPPSMGSIELAWTNLDRNSRQISHSISATNAERVGHPTQKPLTVMRWCLKLLNLPEGSTVLDPYMGSGTTLIACMQMGLNAIGIEIDEGYFKIAQKRVAAERAKGNLFAGAK